MWAYCPPTRTRSTSSPSFPMNAFKVCSKTAAFTLAWSATRHHDASHHPVFEGVAFSKCFCASSRASAIRRIAGRYGQGEIEQVRGRNGGNDVPSVTLITYLHAEEPWRFTNARGISADHRRRTRTVSRGPSGESAARCASCNCSCGAAQAHHAFGACPASAVALLGTDGVRLRRGLVEVTGQAA